METLRTWKAGQIVTIRPPRALSLYKCRVIKCSIADTCPLRNGMIKTRYEKLPDGCCVATGCCHEGTNHRFSILWKVEPKRYKKEFEKLLKRAKEKWKRQ